MIFWGPRRCLFKKLFQEDVYLRSLISFIRNLIGQIVIHNRDLTAHKEIQIDLVARVSLARAFDVRHDRVS